MRLVIDNVSKLYRGKVWGLKDFSLTVETGILGLVGPNGAGKSTLMRILATITRPTEGTVTWEGADGRQPAGGERPMDIVQQPNGLRRVLGYLPRISGSTPT